MPLETELDNRTLEILDVTRNIHKIAQDRHSSIFTVRPTLQIYCLAGSEACNHSNKIK